MKKLKTIIQLITVFIKRPQKLTLSFHAEMFFGMKLWFYDFKDWGFHSGALRMVAGADKMCNHYSYDGIHTIVDILATSSSPSLAAIGYDIYERDQLKGNPWKRITNGATYVSRTMSKKTMDSFWICPVTLFVLGRYPKYLAIRKHQK